MDHQVLLEGNIIHRNDQDAVYWMEQHARDNFSCSLLNITEHNNFVTVRMWPKSPDALSFNFRNRAEKAGYPKGLFSFHSMRSGVYSK